MKELETALKDYIKVRRQTSLAFYELSNSLCSLVALAARDRLDSIQSEIILNEIIKCKEKINRSEY